MSILKKDSKSASQFSTEELEIQRQHVQIINKVSSAVAGILSMENILNMVPQTLVDVLGYKICGVQLVDAEKKNIHFLKINAPEAVLRLVKRFLGFSIYDLKIPLTSRENYLVRSFRDKKVIASESLYDFNRPFVSPRIASLSQKIMRLKSIIGIPLLIRGESVGVLSVGSSKVFADFEIDFLRTFANQISIALYNAQLLEAQKRQYLELEDTYRKLEELNRLQSLDAAKNEFIRVVSHQFRTPLTGLRLQAEFVLEKHQQKILNEPEAVEAIEDMYDRTLFLIRILNDVLNVLEIEQGSLIFKKEKTDFNELIKDVEMNIRSPFLNKKKILTIEAPRTAAPIVVDGEKIRRVLIILLNNAIAFTPENGKVSLRCRFEGSGKKRNLVITASDNGIGISKEDQKKMFEKFYRGANAVQMIPDGTGLGLYIVKHFITLHGGTVAVKSAEKKGATFIITLPVA